MSNCITNVESVRALRLELQPGDMTRYEFLIVGQSVTDLQRNVRHEFDVQLVAKFVEECQDVICASHKDYDSLVRANPFCKRITEEHTPNGTNPWTYVAALVAFVRARAL